MFEPRECRNISLPSDVVCDIDLIFAPFGRALCAAECGVTFG